MRALLLGGTTEGRELGVRLARMGVETVVSVATRAGVDAFDGADATGAALPRIRQGRLDEDGLRSLLAEGFDVLVDATHPYAVEASANARAAAKMTGVPYVRVARAASDYAGCTVVGSVDEAVGAVRRKGNVLATTGSKDLARYTALSGWQARLFARVLDDPSSVEACRALGLADDRIIAARGPFSFEDNVACIMEHGIETLVTKDGGRAGGFDEKARAARECGADCIVVRRPTDEGGCSVDEAAAFVAGLAGR